MARGEYTTLTASWVSCEIPEKLLPRVARICQRIRRVASFRVWHPSNSEVVAFVETIGCSLILF